MENTRLKAIEEVGVCYPFGDPYKIEKFNSNYLIFAEYIIKAILSLEFQDIREEINKEIAYRR